MKRICDNNDEDLNEQPRKQARLSLQLALIVPEHQFFIHLWPYEQLHYLYAMQGFIEVTGSACMDIVRLILIKMIHVQQRHTLPSKCPLVLTGLYPRVYNREDNPVLFTELVERSQIKINEVLKESRHALESKRYIPVRSIHVLILNKVNQRFSAIVPYHDFKPNQYQRYDQFFMVHPDDLEFKCVDIRDRSVIRAYITEGCVSNITLDRLWRLACDAYKDDYEPASTLSSCSII